MFSVNFFASLPGKCAYLNTYSQFLHLSHSGLLIVYPMGLVHGPHWRSSDIDGNMHHLKLEQPNMVIE